MEKREYDALNINLLGHWYIIVQRDKRKAQKITLAKWINLQITGICLYFVTSECTIKITDENLQFNYLLYDFELLKNLQINGLRALQFSYEGIFL